MTRRSTMTRRAFLNSSLAATAAIAAPMIIPSSALGADGAVAPSERVNLAWIGVGDRGMQVMGGTTPLPEAQIVALCDVKADRLASAKKVVEDVYGPGVKTYAHFEELLERKDIDACVIPSCDHWHVLLATAAVKAGKAVYVEKPLGISIEQDQAMRRVVQENKAVFQFGTQQRSDEKFRRACELVRNGRIGKVHTINVWSPASSAGGSTEKADPPATLDYARWLGPAPETPYTKERESNKWWWFISDYATGFIAGWGIHPIDIAFWGAPDLLATPVDIEGKGTYPSEGVCNTATQWEITCKYDSGVTLNYRSAPATDAWKARYGAVTEHGTVFEGTDGWVFVDRRHVKTYPEKLIDSVIQPHELRLYQSDNHMRNFLTCVKDRRPTICPVEEALPPDMFCMVCDHALRMGRKLRWDSAKERYLNDEEANKLLTRPMRAPWTL